MGTEMKWSKNACENKNRMFKKYNRGVPIYKALHFNAKLTFLKCRPYL